MSWLTDGKHVRLARLIAEIVRLLAAAVVAGAAAANQPELVAALCGS